MAFVVVVTPFTASAEALLHTAFLDSLCLEMHMQFDTTLTETDLDPAAQEFARQLREQGVSQDTDYGVDAFQDSFGTRVLRMFGIKRD